MIQKYSTSQMTGGFSHSQAGQHGMPKLSSKNPFALLSPLLKQSDLAERLTVPMNNRPKAHRDSDRRTLKV